MARLFVALVATTLVGASFASRNACKLAAASRRGDLSTGIASTPNPAQFATNTGTLKAAMMFVDFPDAPANDTIESLWNQLMPAANDFYQTASYGRLNMSVQVDKTKFYRMPQESGFYRIIRNDPGMQMGRYIRDAMAAAVAQGTVKWESADVLWIVPTKKAEKVELSPTSMRPVSLPGNPSVRFKTEVTVGQDLQWKWAKFGAHKLLNHETGHSMGLPDLYPGDNFRLSKTKPLRTGEWVGGFDVMGLINGSSPDLFAWHKWKLGWLDDEQIACVDAPTPVPVKITIQPLEVPGGIKAAAVQLSPSKAFVLEVRTTKGVNEGSCSTGLVPYLVDTGTTNYIGPPILVLDLMRKPGDPEPAGCAALRGGPLTSAGLAFSPATNGQSTASYSSAEHGVSFSIETVRNNAYELSISWTGRTPAAGAAKGGLGALGTKGIPQAASLKPPQPQQGDVPAAGTVQTQGVWPLGFGLGPALGGGSGGEPRGAESEDDEEDLLGKMLIVDGF